MVVLAASITTRDGKPLLSRQFRDLTRDRVTELLSAFQGLVANANKQHTFVEDEQVRYVYKPFDDYYIILITSRQSNILQDLDTLNLFSQTINSVLRSFDEHEIFDKSFEILTAFDEIVTLGYKENLSMNQINTYLQMESHEEKIQEIIERNKEFEATEERKKRAKEIQRREIERRAMREMGVDYQPPVGGEHPSASNYDSYYNNASSAAQNSYHMQQQQLPTHDAEVDDLETAQPARHAIRQGRGLKLGSKRPSGPAHAPQHVPAPRQVAPAAAAPRHVAPVAVPEGPENNGILITMEETVNAEITRDGTINSSELKGVLGLRVNDADKAQARIILDQAIDTAGVQFKTHPNIDRNLFLQEKKLGLKDTSKSFPANDQSLGVLRWRKVGKTDDNSLVPLELSVWVATGDAGFQITLEYENNSSFDLHDLEFTIPLLTDDLVIDDDNSTGAQINRISEEEGVAVGVANLAAGESGVVAFTVPANSEDALFPITVGFKNETTSLAGVAVSDVVNAADESAALEFDILSVLCAGEYYVV